MEGDDPGDAGASGVSKEDQGGGIAAVPGRLGPGELDRAGGLRNRREELVVRWRAGGYVPRRGEDHEAKVRHAARVLGESALVTRGQHDDHWPWTGSDRCVDVERAWRQHRVGGFVGD